MRNIFLLLLTPIACALGFFLPSSGTAQGPASCVVGVHAGIPDEDARTATALVCDAVRARGVSIGDPVPAPQPGVNAAYIVRLERLGAAAFITLRQEAPLGHAVTQRRLQLATIEEVPVVSARLAEAVVTNKSLESTQRTSNVAVAEGRKHEQLWGDFSWGPGIAGYIFPGTDVLGAPSPSLQFWYETDHLAVGSTLRFVLGGDMGNDDDMFLFMGDIGARYLFLDTDVSPFVGGGLSFGAYDWSTNGDFEGSADRVGFGAFAEGGVELLRLHRTHLMFDLRVDLPFFALEQTHFDDTTFEETSTETTYIPPISLGIALLF